MDKTPIRIGIIGAAGLSAGKLIAILLKHSHVQLHALVSESSPGKPVGTMHPEFRHLTNLKFCGWDDALLAECDVVFSCKKATETFQYADKVLQNSRFIDLSGDYRLADPGTYQTWYGAEHLRPELLRGQHAVYGLPELNREQIREARLIANPGCYTTTSILACAPFAAAGLLSQQPMIIHAISGVSGAGRNPKAENQFLAVSENVRAYRIGNHQHTPEIEETLSEVAALNGHGTVRALFVPHVGPFKVGILANCYIDLGTNPAGLTTTGAVEVLEDFYRDEPFVRVYEAGTVPEIQPVVGTNYCDIGAVVDERTSRLILVSASDNLIKGAAGQAVQNMNIMMGFSETTALSEAF